MRISENNRKLISSIFRRLFPKHNLYLFGSRVDDLKKGGDIDLLILGEKKLESKEITKFRTELWKAIGEQKIDIVSFRYDEETPFKMLIMTEAIEL
jgi:uncharacterized protein